MAHDAGGGVVPQHPLDAPRRLCACRRSRSPCRRAGRTPCRRRRHGGSRPRSRPRRVFSSAFSSGQSETASEPSFIASVSRFGLATEPESRWSRPITTGAFSSPRRHHLVEGEPRLVPIAEADPADARRQPLEGDALARHVEPLVQVGVLREQLLHLRVGGVDVLRVAAQRAPAEWADAPAEQRPDIGRHEARKGEGVLQPLLLGNLADVVAIVEHRHALRSRSRPSPRHGRAWTRGPPSRPPPGRSRAWPATRPGSSRPAGSRSRDHARRSGR